MDAACTTVRTDSAWSATRSRPVWFHLVCLALCALCWAYSCALCMAFHVYATSCFWRVRCVRCRKASSLQWHIRRRRGGKDGLSAQSDQTSPATAQSSSAAREHCLGGQRGSPPCARAEDDGEAAPLAHIVLLVLPRRLVAQHGRRIARRLGAGMGARRSWKCCGVDVVPASVSGLAHRCHDGSSA